MVNRSRSRRHPRISRAQRLQRPPRFVRALRFERRTIARIRRTHLHPRYEISDDCVRQLRFLWRHGQIILEMLHSPDQQTLLRFPRHKRRRATVSAHQPPRARIEAQPALDLLRLVAVAFVAVLNQHRPNLLFKERDPRRVRRTRADGDQQNTGDAKFRSPKAPQLGESNSCKSHLEAIARSFIGGALILRETVHANTPFNTCPCTSVSRRFEPL